MIEKLKKTIQSELLKLPKEKQDAVNSFDWITKTQEIGQIFKLTEDEIFDLQIETGLVLVSIIDLNLFKAHLEQNILLSEEITEKISNEIIEKIFFPIAENIELAIKNSFNLENAHWNQTVNFIVSGGDYSVFLEK